MIIGTISLPTASETILANFKPHFDYLPFEYVSWDTPATLAKASLISPFSFIGGVDFCTSDSTYSIISQTLELELNWGNKNYVGMET